MVALGGGEAGWWLTRCRRKLKRLAGKTVEGLDASLRDLDSFRRVLGQRERESGTERANSANRILEIRRQALWLFCGIPFLNGFCKAYNLSPRNTLLR